MNTMNKIQAAYMLAKSRLETLESLEKELNHQYIIDNEIQNPDGSIPEYIYCMEDDDAFDKANEEFAKTLEESSLWDQILSARFAQRRNY